MAWDDTGGLSIVGVEMHVHAPKHTEFILNVTQSYLQQSKTLTHVFLQEKIHPL